MLITERHLMCDNCGAQYGIDNMATWESAKDLRSSAKNDGWRIGKKDLCETCRDSTKDG